MTRLVLLGTLILAGSPQAAAQFDTFGCNVACDGYAGYQGQSSCKSWPQPGVVEFRDLVLDSFPTTTDLGIMRSCSVGGQSEHKEGRAWDWGVLATKASQKAIADGVLAALLETDSCGNKHALARRFGIMYMIWNKKMWRAYKPSLGWQPYYGSNPHTDHVHFSFSWDGALEDTSYYTGQGTPPEDEDQPTCTPGAVAGAGGELFKDMPKGAFGYDEAKLLYEAGITNGCQSSPNLLFCPTCPTSRYSAVVFVLRAMGADVSNPPAKASFNDVPKSKWYFRYVEKAKELGMTSGCGNGNFCPFDTTTRAQMAKFIVEGAGWPLVAGSQTFADVTPDKWFYKHVETLKANCVTNGCGDGANFCPQGTLSRAEAAIFIARAFDLDDKNKCLDYCDPSLCAEGAHCEEWTECAGFDSVCDESGTQHRTCHDFTACSSTSTDPTCGEFSTSESQGCQRDTDGTVVDGWGPWSPCGGFDGPCDESGTQARTRTICADGQPTQQTQHQACARDTDGTVVQGWSPWSECGGFDGPCDATGHQVRSRSICQDGAVSTDTETVACETTTPDCTDGTDATDGASTDGTDGSDASADGTDSSGDDTGAADDGTDTSADGVDPGADGAGGGDEDTGGRPSAPVPATTGGTHQGCQTGPQGHGSEVGLLLLVMLAWGLSRRLRISPQ